MGERWLAGIWRWCPQPLKANGGLGAKASAAEAVRVWGQSPQPSEARDYGRFLQFFNKNKYIFMHISDLK